MKQKTITLPHCELLVVELQDKSHGVKFTEKGNLTYFRYDEMKGSYPVVKKLPEGNWQHIGAVDDVSEEQADGFVDKSIYTGLYGHYVNDIPLNIYCYKNATESFNTLLTANGVVFENPVKFFNNKEIEANGSLLDWHEAQSKVFDKERTYLFIKVD